MAITGTRRNDRLIGTTQADEIFGLDGVDTISGLAGTDVIWGGNGNDSIDGGDDNDTLYGESGADTLKGGPGDDLLNGGMGNDIIAGGDGFDEAVYALAFENYQIVLQGTSIRISALSGTEGADTVSAVERIRFSDGSYDVATGLFEPGEVPTNRAPVTQADAYASQEDLVLSVTALAGVLANDGDPDGDALTVTAFDARSAAGGTVSVAANGAFTYTPTSNYNGTDRFTYTVSDGRGAVTVGEVILSILAVNDAPVAAGDAYATTQGKSLDVTAGSGLLANDRDIDGDVLRVVGFDAYSVNGGTVSAAQDGAFRYTPAAGYSGIDRFTYRVGDGSATSQATVTIEVATNRAPVARADAFVFSEDLPASVAAASGLLVNDTDPDGDALTVTGFDARSAAGGTVSVTAAGAFTYSPARNFNGTDRFGYLVSDGRGGVASAEVALSVLPVNDAPVAVADLYTVAQGTTLAVAAGTGVLSNDSDVDGDVLRVTRADALSQRGGSVSVSQDGAFQYTPAPGFSGVDRFGYRAGDGTAAADGVVTIDVRSSSSPYARFEQILSQLPEGEWARLNANRLLDVAVPDAQRNFEMRWGSPSSIIHAWGAATWDTDNNQYLIWGGGHYNYEGNEVYAWNAATLLWERESLPSKIERVSDNNRYETVDGYEHSPISSHTYDNLEYLDVAGRMINFGGSAAHAGGGFVQTDGVYLTGPYLWDPSKADPNKVGGLDGSQVNPAQFPNVTGGQMWENRGTFSGTPFKDINMVQGTTDYTSVNGVDVVFVNPYNQGLYKYTVPDVANPQRDTWELVGLNLDPYWGPGAGAYDPVHNIYVRTSGTTFTFWNLNQGSGLPYNQNFVPDDGGAGFVLNGNWGMEYDPVRDAFALWDGSARVWYLDAPSTLGKDGWTLNPAPAPALPAPSIVANFQGINGRWDYVDAYDVFVGIVDHATGDVWAYKPVSASGLDFLA